MSSTPQVSPQQDKTTMRAAVYRRFGGPEVVTTISVNRPEPAHDEVLVQVKATTVSTADHRARARDVPAGLLIPSSFVLGLIRPKRPILGMDVAGTVVAVGESVDRFAVGDDVLAMLGSAFGGHAEYAIVRAKDAIAKKPSTITFEDAVSLIFGGITARGYLNQISIGPGTTVLVNGASGAVGTAMLQLAKAAGAHVTGVTSSRNASFVSTLGADRVIPYDEADFASEGTRYDAVVDCVGNAPVARVRNSLNPGGAVLLVAGDLRSLLSASRQAKRHGITIITGPGDYRSEDLEYLVDLAVRASFVPTVDRTFSFDHISDAHRFVDGGHKRGSVVVTMPSRDR